jgi:hypothetical protein
MAAAAFGSWALALGCQGSTAFEIFGAGAGEGGPGETPPAVVDKGCAPESGRVTARRLSRSEYNNTVRDLFVGLDVGRPADELPDDVAGVNGLTVSDLYLEKHETITANLAALAVERGLIACNPVDIGERVCARQTLEPLMKRAWRRPVTEEEVDGVLAHLDVVAAEAGEKSPFAQAIRLAVQEVLMSPSFLFRFEPVVDPTSPASQPLDSFELASRLSYFIYDSMPDAALFAAAESGELADAAGIEKQVRRMLADPKSKALVDKLAGDWLSTDRVDLLHPNPTVYPTFDAELRQSLKQETALFVKDFLLGDRSFKDLFDADFTYVNARLGKHYGLSPEVQSQLSADFARVSLAASPGRGGILTQGAVLAATSVPHNNPTAEITETSVILRGQFVLEHLLCADLGAPPDGLDINQIQADAQKDIPSDAPRKIREGVRQAMQPCAGCHSYMDPIGFSMEHFDVTGGWRDLDFQGTAVDSTGALKGEAGAVVGSFDGARSLGTLIKSDARVSACVTETVMKLALGRTLELEDHCRVENTARSSDSTGNRLGDLILSLTQSRSFTHQQGEVP